MSFLAPAFLWLLLAIPPVVLLHFLRNRRRQQTVSALFLWQRATEQISVTRRFALWWLLLLQILAVAILALVLAQPVLTGAGAPDRVIVIDASASMAASDPDGVRLLKAVQVAGELIAEGGRVALVRAGSDPVVLAPLGADAATVATALAGLAAADPDADLAGALQLAAGLAPEAELHLITDAAPPAGNHVYHGVAGAGSNVGITTFDLGLQQAFIALASSFPRPQVVRVDLFRDGQPAGTSELLVPAGGQASVSIPLSDRSGLFEARITPPPDDALDLDDVAWAGARQLRVHYAGGSEALERALAAMPGIERVAAATAADVRIVELGPEQEPPAGNVLVWRQRSAAPTWVQIRDWDQSDPLLRFVDLREVQVGLDAAWQPDERPGGGRVLARSSDFRPVIVAWRDQERLVVEFGFHPGQTDMIYRPAFPTLMANAMEAFRGERELRLGQVLPAGSTFGGVAAERVLTPGVYQLPGGPAAASLLSAGETRLPGPQAEVAAEAVAGAAGVDQAPASDRGIAWLLLLLVPVILGAEWLAWSRRTAW